MILQEEHQNEDIDEEIDSVSCLLKQVINQLDIFFGVKRSRIRPRPALKLFTKMQRVLHFQRAQIKSLAKASLKKVCTFFLQN